jgi:hypothetical protein
LPPFQVALSNHTQCFSSLIGDVNDKCGWHGAMGFSQGLATSTNHDWNYIEKSAATTQYWHWFSHSTNACLFNKGGGDSVLFG